MPRAQQSKVGAIVDFFRTAPLESADIVMQLSRDALNARKQKSEKAKERSKTPQTVGGPGPAVAAVGAPKKKKAKAKVKAKTPKAPKPPVAETQPTLPDPGMETGVETEADDLVGSQR